MNPTAIVILVGYSVLTVVGVLVALGVYVSTRSRRRADTERLVHGENRWLVIVLVLMLALLFATIFLVPYGADAKEPKQTVHVSAQQFSFQLEPSKLKAGVATEFLLSSTDVNHGFGVYNDDDEFLFQVQIQPGMTQKAVFTFDEPGRYHVLCLEFCGVGHHLMQATFEVTR